MPAGRPRKKFSPQYDHGNISKHRGGKQLAADAAKFVRKKRSHHAKRPGPATRTTRLPTSGRPPIS
jgi:hypothetical protein